MSKTQFVALILPLFMAVTTAFAQQHPENRTVDITPQSSEFNILRLESVAKEAIAEIIQGRKTIIIARLSVSERSRELNRRRLYNVQNFLSRYTTIGAENTIAAEGEKARGYGRVEIYVGGKLFDTLTVLRNRDLEVDCCEGDINFYPGKDRLRLSSKKRKQ